MDNTFLLIDGIDGYYNTKDINNINLKKIYLKNCINIKYIPKNLINLEYLYINNCKNIKYIPKTLINLKYLYLRNTNIKYISKFFINIGTLIIDK